MEPIVGIDLGTTNSCVSIWRSGKLEVIPDRYGNHTIPSVVAYTRNTKYIGNEAKNQISLNPGNTIYEVKRLIGRNYTDETVQNDLEFLSYNIVGDTNNHVNIKTEVTNVDKHKNIFTPEEISAEILKELKFMASSYLGIPISKAVITVPAYFNDIQRQATKDAALIAGLDCVRIINEPTAASLAYGIGLRNSSSMNVLIYDLGGGTLDVSLINICDGLYEVLASTGNTHLGGADFDNKLIKYCINKFKKKHKCDEIELLSLQKLKNSCESAKKKLSNTWKTVIKVDNFWNGIDLVVPISKKDFEFICKDLFLLCLKPVGDVLNLADLNKEDIDEVVLVGGATRMPQVRENLRNYFNKTPNCNINPDEVVSCGAAIQGYMLSHNKDPFVEDMLLLDIIPLSLGVQTLGNIMDTIIPINSIIPITRTRKYTTDSDNETEVLIRIYEGERKMTKDNNLIGEFLLSGIEAAPRGIAEIEVTFTVDVNGVLSVIAEDLKNNENKRSLIITGNKGRMNRDEIEKLVKEAKELEIKDYLEREKKQLYYEIEDLCANIIYNINESGAKEEDKLNVKKDVNSIIEWLCSKNFLDHEKNDYFDLLEKIKKKYGTLMLRVSKEVYKSAKTEDVSATSVFNDDDEDELNQDIDIDLDGDKSDDEEDKQAIKEIRNELIGLANSVMNVLNIVETTDVVNDIFSRINDILLDVHVREKISLLEYKQYINEINKICDDFMDKHSELLNVKMSKHDELEALCFSMAYSEHVEQVEQILNWLLDIKVRKRQMELENKEFIEITDEEYQEKINYLTNL